MSIVIPTFNGSQRIGNCLECCFGRPLGGTWRSCGERRLDGQYGGGGEPLRRGSADLAGQRRSGGGPESRRKGGRGEILLFTDDDCVPMADWLDAMLSSFEDAVVTGAKGVYRTRQKSLAARFVQLEYEDKYRLMAGLDSIDFIDTYSAGFRRERFMEMCGYDTSFPVACAEDIELSYRMSARGWKMKFVPAAIVYHTHPDNFWNYLKKKYKFAFWRVLAVRKNPSKGIRDSHTPQIMKLQLLFAPALVAAAVADLAVRPSVSPTLLVVTGFMASTLPFALRTVKRDAAVGLLSPLLLAGRSVAQFLGVAFGVIYARNRPVEVPNRLPA